MKRFARWGVVGLMLLVVFAVPVLGEAAPLLQSNPGVPESCWDLDETSGSRSDAFGGNTLTDNNTVLYGTGVVGNAADFEVSNSETLSRADNASLSTGDIDYTVAGWVNLETVGVVQSFATKYVSGQQEYLFKTDTANHIVFVAYNGSGTSIGSVTSTATLVAGTWYWVRGWHDAANNQVGVQVNNGSAVTAATTGTGGDSTAAFYLGGRSAGEMLDGMLDSWVFYKKVLSAGEVTFLYDSGTGVSCAELNPATATPTATLTSTPTATATVTLTPTITPSPTMSQTPRFPRIMADVINGGFEFGDLTGWSCGDCAVTDQIPHGGNWSVERDSDADLLQSVVGLADECDTWRLRWAARSAVESAGHAVSYEWFACGGWPQTLSYDAGSVWTYQYLDMLRCGESTSVDITFSGVDADQIDDVSLICIEAEGAYDPDAVLSVSVVSVAPEAYGADSYALIAVVTLFGLLCFGGIVLLFFRSR